MIIREAISADIPSLIDLLKISLGESLIPKSEALWNWKHVQNPFGQSPVLIAEEQGEILGVRAFLRWDYCQNGKIIKACRAVDTATHPRHQGKGIFSKLTLEMLEKVKAEQVEVIFNTPNSSSTPGYLKMGWEKWGKLPLKLNFHFGKTGKSQIPNSDWTSISTLIHQIETLPDSGPSLKTRLRPGYLNWRYRDSPLFPYHFLSDGEYYLLIYRIKEGKMGREFRICDFFTAFDLSPKQIKDLRKNLTAHIQDAGARFSSFSGLTYPQQKVLELGGLPILKIGPMVTLRQLHDHLPPMNQDWAWSLGDLEVF